MRCWCLVFFQTHYRPIFVEEKAAWLEEEGVRAVDCDKLPLAGEGGVWFGE